MSIRDYDINEYGGKSRKKPVKKDKVIKVKEPKMNRTREVIITEDMFKVPGFECWITRDSRVYTRNKERQKFNGLYSVSAVEDGTPQLKSFSWMANKVWGTPLVEEELSSEELNELYHISVRKYEGDIRVEEWKPVGIGAMEVSSWGNLRMGGYLYTDDDNRIIVRFKDKGKFRSLSMNQLVYHTFVYPIGRRGQIHHIDNNSLNLRADNLTWRTNSEDPDTQDRMELNMSDFLYLIKKNGELIEENKRLRNASI